MNREDTIEEFCLLLSEVGTRVFNSQKPFDCICKDANNPNPVNPNPVIDKEIVEFIKDAVYSKIKTTKNTTMGFSWREYARVCAAIKQADKQKKCPGKIQLIKILRDEWGYGLKDAKILVETAEEKGLTKQTECASKGGDGRYYKTYRYDIVE